MVTFSPASVVVIPFPFSDLSGSKLRPAVVLTETGHGDWLLCQVTSNPYVDATAIQLAKENLAKGGFEQNQLCPPDEIVHRKCRANREAHRNFE